MGEEMKFYSRHASADFVSLLHRCYIGSWESSPGHATCLLHYNDLSIIIGVKNRGIGFSREIDKNAISAHATWDQILTRIASEQKRNFTFAKVQASPPGHSRARARARLSGWIRGINPISQILIFSNIVYLASFQFRKALSRLMVQSVWLTNYGGARFNRFAGTIKARKITLVALSPIGIRESDGSRCSLARPTCIYHLHRLELKSSFSRETVNNAFWQAEPNVDE